MTYLSVMVLLTSAAIHVGWNLLVLLPYFTNKPSGVQ